MRRSPVVSHLRQSRRCKPSNRTARGAASCRRAVSRRAATGRTRTRCCGATGVGLKQSVAL